MDMAKRKQANRAAAELPYERFINCGAGVLTNAELIAVVLRSGIRDRPVMEIARDVLSLRGGDGTSLCVLHDLTLEDLRSIRGVGEVSAVKLLCLTELSRRISMETRGSGPVFVSASDIAGHYMESLRHEKNEIVMLLHLNNRMALIREERLSVGTINASLLSPRNVFKSALEHGAVNLVLLHNHPSGDPAPSRCDIDVTRRIGELASMMDMHLADHIIIGDNTYFSMLEGGYLN